MLALIPFVHFLTAAALAAALNWLALQSWRRSRGAHWTERARLLYPARVSATGNLFLIPGCCAAAQAALLPEVPLSALWSAVAALPGAILGTYPMDREIFPHITFRAWLHEVGATWVLQWSRVVIFVSAMFLMPGEWDWRAPALALGVVALQTWLVWGGALWLVLRLKLVVPAPERLLAIVAAVAQRFDTPVPNTWMMRGVASNAMALPHTCTLVFTERLLSLSPDEEVAAICAHEFAHLSESRRVLAIRYLSTLAFFPLLFIKPIIHAFDLPGLVIVAAAALLLSRAVRTFAHRMEKRADAIAFAHEGPEGGAYARALVRLYEANQIPAVMPGKRQLHPHLYDRLLAAGMTPDFTRPAPARKRSWVSVVVYSVMLSFIILAAFRQGAEERPRHPRPSRQLERPP